MFWGSKDTIIYISLKWYRGAYLLLIKLYILKTSHCGWNPEQNSTYNSPRIINVREIDRNYLILAINKRLFTMKVENHDTTKLGNQHENLLKREIQRMWTNIKLCLTTYIHVYYSFPIQQYVCYAYLHYKDCSYIVLAHYKDCSFRPDPLINSCFWLVDF